MMLIPQQYTGDFREGGNLDIKEIFKAIKPLKRRIHLNNAFLCWAYGFILAGGLSLLVSSAALFFPIPFVKDKLIGIYFIVILLSLVVSLFLGPKTVKTLQIADSLGLKERLITAYHLQNEKGTIVEMQRRDAIKALSGVDFRKLYSLKVPVLKILIGFTLLLMVFITSLIPTGAKEKAGTKEDIINETKKQAEKIDQKRKEIKKSSMVSDKKLEEMNRKVDELLKELNQAKNDEDALKSLSKAKHELEKLKNNTIKQDLEKISEKLSANTLSKDLGEALKEGDSDKIGKAIEQMKEKLKDANKEDLKDLAEKVEEAAGEITDSKLKEDLTELSQAIKDGNINSASNNLDTLSIDLSKTVENSSESLSALQQSENTAIDQLMELLNNSKYAIAKQAGINLSVAQSSTQQGGSQNGAAQQGSQAGSGGQAGSKAGSSGQSSQNGQAGESGQGDQGEQNGQSNQGGQGSQSGQGGQGGQGSQNGQSASGGAGEGSTNSGGGYKAGESSGGVKRPGGKKEEKYEAIYAPNRLGGDSPSSQVNGTKSESGQSQWNDVKSIPFGESSKVPYSEVYSEYKDEAMSGLMEAQIPSGMKDMVRDYFTILE